MCDGLNGSSHIWIATLHNQLMDIGTVSNNVKIGTSAFNESHTFSTNTANSWQYGLNTVCYIDGERHDIGSSFDTISASGSYDGNCSGGQTYAKIHMTVVIGARKAAYSGTIALQANLKGDGTASIALAWNGDSQQVYTEAGTTHTNGIPYTVSLEETRWSDLGEVSSFQWYYTDSTGTTPIGDQQITNPEATNETFNNQYSAVQSTGTNGATQWALATGSSNTWNYYNNDNHVESHDNYYQTYQEGTQAVYNITNNVFVTNSVSITNNVQLAVTNNLSLTNLVVVNLTNSSSGSYTSDYNFAEISNLFMVSYDDFTNQAKVIDLSDAYNTVPDPADDHSGAVAAFNAHVTAIQPAMNYANGLDSYVAQPSLTGTEVENSSLAARTAKYKKEVRSIAKAQASGSATFMITVNGCDQEIDLGLYSTWVTFFRSVILVYLWWRMWFAIGGLFIRAFGG